MIEIYDVKKNRDNKLRYIPKHLPQPPTRIVATGYSGSGKTNVIKNIIFNPKMGYCHYFDLIFVICGSLDDIAEYERWGKKTKCVYKDKGKTKELKMIHKLVIKDGISIDEFNELLSQLEHMEDFNDKRILFVLDDMIVSNLLKNTTTLSPLDTIFVRGRHITQYGLSCIISTQKYNQVKQNLRTINATQQILFHGLPTHQLNLIASEISGGYSENDFKEIYQKYTREKYSFIIVNLKEAKEKYIQDKNFNYIQ